MEKLFKETDTIVSDFMDVVASVNKMDTIIKNKKEEKNKKRHNSCSEKIQNQEEERSMWRDLQDSQR